MVLMKRRLRARLSLPFVTIVALSSCMVSQGPRDVGPFPHGTTAAIHRDDGSEPGIPAGCVAENSNASLTILAAFRRLEDP